MLRRLAAVLAACSAVLHGIAIGHATNPAAAVVTVVMAVACLYCAGDLWIRGALRAWVLVALMNLAMIAIHIPASPGHHHGGDVATATMSTHHSTVMTLATALAAVEVIVATSVVFYRTRATRLTTASVSVSNDQISPGLRYSSSVT